MEESRGEKYICRCGTEEGSFCFGDEFPGKLSRDSTFRSLLSKNFPVSRRTPRVLHAPRWSPGNGCSVLSLGTFGSIVVRSYNVRPPIMSLPRARRSDYTLPKAKEKKKEKKKKEKKQSSRVRTRRRGRSRRGGLSKEDGRRWR